MHAMSASGNEDGLVEDSLCRLQRLICRHSEAITELAAELTSAHPEIAKACAPPASLAGTGGATGERFRRASHTESLGAGEKCAADPAPATACSSDGRCRRTTTPCSSDGGRFHHVVGAAKAGSKGSSDLPLTCGHDGGRFNHVASAVKATRLHLPAVPHDATTCEDVVDDPFDVTVESMQKYSTTASHSDMVQSSSSTVHWGTLRASVRGRLLSDINEVTKSKSGRIFADPEALKEAIRKTLTEPPFDLTSFYHRTGCSQAVARSRAFEAASLAMVCLSSLWMGVEIEFDDSVGLFDARPVFQVMAQVFCVFFVAELSVRFLAFRDKLDVRRDPWFLFDAALVVLVVFETWVMSTAVALMDVDGAATANLRVLAIFRTFRVLRVLRLARVLRQLPELMVIVRGIAIAFRGIATIIGLLSFVIYLGAIVFRVLLDGTGVGRDHFCNIPSAMGTLLLELTLSGGRGTAIIRQAYGDHSAYAFLLLVFVIFSNVTVMGVLSGLLVQTVKAVAEIEKEEKAVKGMQSTMNDLWDLITRHDENHDGMISMSELQAILLDRDSARVLQGMGVDLDGLGSVASFVFEENDGALTKGQFKRMLLDLRNGQAAKVKDHVETRKYVSAQFKKGRPSPQHSLTASATSSSLRDLGKAHAWGDVLALTAPGPQRSMQHCST
mmetsp:Transcript_10661/g.30180  ORF Transcript_10661/g.30180 Transcript_10661/m.30180 type:complete len:670 (-) Transcript_10661:91-2100(-)